MIIDIIWKVIMIAFLFMIHYYYNKNNNDKNIG